MTPLPRFCDGCFALYSIPLPHLYAMRLRRLFFHINAAAWLLLLKVLIVLLAMAAILIWWWYNARIQSLEYKVSQ